MVPACFPDPSSNPGAASSFFGRKDESTENKNSNKNNMTDEVQEEALKQTVLYSELENLGRDLSEELQEWKNPIIKKMTDPADEQLGL